MTIHSKVSCEICSQKSVFFIESIDRLILLIRKISHFSSFYRFRSKEKLERHLEYSHKTGE